MFPTKQKHHDYGNADKEMLHEKDYEPQSSDSSGSYSYRDNYDAA